MVKNVSLFHIFTIFFIESIRRSLEMICNVVFLHDQHDFILLQEAVNIYSKASNTQFNYKKSRALSLSGNTHPN